MKCLPAATVIQPANETVAARACWPCLAAAGIVWHVKRRVNDTRKCLTKRSSRLVSSESVKGESVVVQVSLRKAVPILPFFLSHTITPSYYYNTSVILQPYNYHILLFPGLGSTSLLRDTSESLRNKCSWIFARSQRSYKCI